MEVDAFADIAAEFRRRIEVIQWASMTTVDGRGRPRGRLVHPVWEEPVGWLATGRHSFKAKHLEVGKHKVQVRATDLTGLVDGTPAKVTWKVRPRR